MTGQRPRTRELEACPYCQESILAEAQKCRYCGEWLDARVDGRDRALVTRPTAQRVSSVPASASQRDDRTEVGSTERPSRKERERLEQERILRTTPKWLLQAIGILYALAGLWAIIRAIMLVWTIVYAH